MLAYTDASICNLALTGHIGAAKITALTELTAEGRACNLIYELVRNEVMASLPWKFAKKRAALVATTAPDFGYSYAFTLPEDCLRPLSLEPASISGAAEPEFTIEGQLLLTDESEANLHYIAEITDPSLFSSSFVKAFALLLGSRLAMSVAKSKTLAASLQQSYSTYLEEDAMVTDARSDNVQPYKPSTYEDARA